jgi:hypothetical protein
MDEQQPSRIDWTLVPIHPFLFAAHPILFLFAGNAGQMVGGEQALYPSIIPVNSFRTIFNYYFGAKYPRLPDQSFFSTWLTPYRFMEYVPEEPASKTPAR